MPAAFDRRRSPATLLLPFRLSLHVILRLLISILKAALILTHHLRCSVRCGSQLDWHCEAELLC